MGLVFPYIYKNTGSVEIVTWADGTEDQIQAMIDAAKAGKINLNDYWSVGDERVIHHSAMVATGVGESHAAQDQTWVLMDTGENSGYVFEDDTPVHFVVGMKDCFNEVGYMNPTDTNAGSWHGCARRAWCNEVLPGSFPAKTRNFFKPFKTITAETYNGTTLKTSIDNYALFAEKEIFGIRSEGNVTEANTLKQIEYYETAANRYKKCNSSNSEWWQRTPATRSGGQSFCRVNANATAGYSGARYTRGISPFGCI